MLGVAGPNLSQQQPTCRNTSQHGGQTHTTCCAQQCCDMLSWHVSIVWPGLKIEEQMKKVLTNPDKPAKRAPARGN